MALFSFYHLKVIYVRCFTDYVSGGELFTHLYQRERFCEDEVRLYIGEIILALEHLHKVSFQFTYAFNRVGFPQLTLALILG